jgi:hypothetical protein
LNKRGRATELALLLALLSGCALGDGGRSVTKACNIPTDQKNTISGAWKTTPIPVAFHSGAFNLEEQTVIMRAADTWNKFFASSKGIPMLDYGTKTSPKTSGAPKPAGNCTTGILSGTQFVGAVVIYKQASWPYTNIPDAIALTSYCPIPSTPYNSFYMAYIELNYQNFFVQGRKLPDTQTILTHEFGHLIGLNHSCENATKTGVPNCSDAALPAAYIGAIMFPVFGFDSAGYGEVKTNLNQNDQGRANCLYTSPST